MSDTREHAFIPRLKEQFAEGRIDRREFLRTATLLGMSAAAAYAVVGRVTGERAAAPARAATKGGVLRIGMRVKDIKNPHTYSWIVDSNITRQVTEYLTETGHDNVTRPKLLERWEATDDLKTWTLHLRKDVAWHNGRAFVADDVVWNLKHALHPDTGSSVLGLMKGYMMNDAGTALWDANAIEKVDDHTVRLNARTAQLAVPEHLFHYPLLILDPEEDGVFDVGSNGLGAFELVEHAVGKKAVLAARADYWGEGPHVDTLEFRDLGDDPTAAIAALASKQVHGIMEADIVQLDALKGIPHVRIHQVTTAQTAVVRGKVPQKPFDDARVRRALRLAVHQGEILQLAHRNLGQAAEHHHVCPIHPEYAQLPFFERDVDAAKALLAEAGYPDGLELEIACKKDPAWELNAVQGMARQWHEAGIRVRINVMPSTQFWEVWDKTRFGFTTWTHRPLGVMVLGLAYRTGVPWNESEYSNPEFDRLLTEAEGILDAHDRREVMAELERIMQEDGPIVQPLWRSVFTFMDERVGGFQMHPTSYVFGSQLSLEA